MGVKKNFLYSSILTTANYIFPILTFPYVTRVLGPSNIGICNFVDSIINYFLLFSMLGIGSVGVREIAKVKNSPNSLSTVFSSLVCFNLLTTIFAIIVLFFCVLYIPKFYNYREMLGIGTLKILFNTLLIEWLFKGMEDFRYITIRSLVVRSLYVVSVFLFVRDADDYIVYYFLMAMMIIVNSIFNLCYSRKVVRFSFSGISIKPYCGPIFIMGAYSLLTKMYTTFNTTYLGFLSGETEVGYYSTAYRLFSIILSLFTAFTGVMLPRMSSILSDGKITEFRQMLSKSIVILFTFAIPVMVYAIVFAPDIIYLIAGPKFSAAIIPFRISIPLILVIGYEQIIIIQGLMAMDKNKAVLINSIFGAFVGVVLCVLLIPSLKSAGASIVWLCSELAVMASASYFIYKYMGISFPFKKLLVYVIYHIPLLIFLYLIHQINVNYIFLLIIGVFATVVYVVLLQYLVVKDSVIISILKTINIRSVKHA